MKMKDILVVLAVSAIFGFAVIRIGFGFLCMLQNGFGGAIC